jgi:hypothetical protein
MKETIEEITNGQNNREVIINTYYLFVGIASTLLSCIAISLVLCQTKERFGVVDAGVLVALQAKEIAKSYPNGQLPPEKLERISKNLKEKVQIWGDNRGLTLLAKGAVWSGQLPDYTDEILVEMGL